MPSLDSIQSTIHDWIMRTPQKYFSPGGMVDKAKKEAKELFDATEILKVNERTFGCIESIYTTGMKYKEAGNNAIANILLKDISLDAFSLLQVKHSIKLAELTYDVQLELGDVLFAVGCLSNVYDVSWQESYEKFVVEDQKKSKTKIEKWIEKNIHTPSRSHLRKEGRSSYDYDERDYRPQKVLFYRLQNNINTLEHIVPGDDEMMSRDATRDWVIISPSTKKALDASLGSITDNLIDIAHRYGFTFEDAFTAVMGKNTWRENNNYQKEVL